MRRYWVAGSCFLDGHVHIAGDDYKHICLVCRRQVGDRFEVLQEDGKAYLVELIEVGKKQAVARIIESRQMTPLPRPHIHLALSVAKTSTMEKVMEKSVELGVKGLHLFSSDFSFAKLSTKDFEKKLPRWQRILKGATQQTGRGELMTLTHSSDLDVLLKRMPSSGAFGIFAYEGSGQASLSQRLAELPDNLDEVWIFVGSEGGFSENDVNLFSNYSMIPTGLGTPGFTRGNGLRDLDQHHKV